ncbi:hypothetical protein [Pedobacter sp.]|uniref:hypothetical protein n=1 Tax=Pedobacter sp. TaxID=1411316 RepID=UPI003C42DD2D
MKEIIRLAEQFLSIARLGFCEGDLAAINVRYIGVIIGEVETISMGRVSRRFNKGNKGLDVPDYILFDERARNEFIEEYTLKLNELRSVIEFNRRKVIEEKIEQLQQHLTVAA